MYEKPGAHCSYSASPPELLHVINFDETDSRAAAASGDDFV